MGLAGAEKGPLTGATEGGPVAESACTGCAPVDGVPSLRGAVRFGFRHVGQRKHDNEPDLSYLFAPQSSLPASQFPCKIDFREQPGRALPRKM